MRRLVICALALCLALTGCSSGLTIFSNYRRLESIELVRTVTADKAEEGVNVTIYGTAGEESEARMYENTGPSIGVAMGELMLLPLGREAILSHTECMLVGEALAGERLDECLDYLERFSEMRLDTGLLIVRGGTARDLIRGIAGEETPASDVVAGLTKNIDRVGEGYVFTCREVASSLASNGCALVQCVRGEGEEKLFEKRGELDLKPAGFAVMLPESTAAFLSEEETLGTMLVLRKLRSRNMDIPVEGAVLTVSVDSVKTDIAPVFDRDGALTEIKIRLELKANVICMDGYADLESDRVRRDAEDCLSAAMARAVAAAVRAGQKIGLDFMDLEGVVSRREPIKFQDMPDSWDSLFPTLRADIDVESTLLRTYDIVDPPEMVREEEEVSPWEKLTESVKGS